MAKERGSAVSGDEVIMPDGSRFAFWRDGTRYSKVYHVDCKHRAASDANPGTEERPFATIQRAADALEPGQKAVVHAGVYREWVRPRRGGESPTRMVAYEAAPGEEVIVRGSRVWKPAFEPSAGWRLTNGPRGAALPAVWMGAVPREFFSSGYNPFALTNVPKELMTFEKNWPAAEVQRFQLRRGIVFENGRPLRQVFRSEDLAGAGDGVFWVEETGLRIHLRPLGDADPRKSAFEVTTQEQVFAPEEQFLGYIRVSGFVFEHAADGVPIPQRAALSASRGHHWIIERNTVRHANACGIDVGAQDWHAVRRDDGPVGGHVIRANRVTDCGVCGILGVGSVDRTLVEDNVVERIGGRVTERLWETAGLKMHLANSVLIRRNVFRRITDACGLWLDYENKNCRVTGNVFADIVTLNGGVYLEVSHERNVIDSNVFWNIRAASINPDEHAAYQGGKGVNTDASDRAIVANNIFGELPDSFAACMSLYQKSRVVGSRVGLCWQTHVANNIFYRCPNRVLFGRTKDNTSDGNLFSAAPGPGSGPAPAPAPTFYLQFPEPPAKLDLAAWREYLGFDLGSREARMEASFDVETLTLTIKVADELPKAVSTAQFCAGLPTTLGPLSAADVKRLKYGVTITFPRTP